MKTAAPPLEEVKSLLYSNLSRIIKKVLISNILANIELKKNENKSNKNPL